MRHPSANTRMRQLVVLARQRHTVRQRKESCALAEPATSYSKSIGVSTAYACISRAHDQLEVAVISELRWLDSRSTFCGWPLTQIIWFNRLNQRLEVRGSP